MGRRYGTTDAGTVLDVDDVLDAGRLDAWLVEVRAAIAGSADAVVACGDCAACCSSSQFVHVAPDEADALAHIPHELLFPAPGAPRGHVLMGYDAAGRCPMLVDGRCSIYAHRPRTCRTYDCRVFAAAGVDAADDGKPAIADRARRWRFEVSTDDERARLLAIRAAAEFVRRRERELPAGTVPPTSTHLAVLAVEIHETFLGDASAPRQPAVTEVAAELARRRPHVGRPTSVSSS